MAEYLQCNIQVKDDPRGRITEEICVKKSANDEEKTGPTSNQPRTTRAQDLRIAASQIRIAQAQRNIPSTQHQRILQAGHRPQTQRAPQVCPRPTQPSRVPQVRPRPTQPQQPQVCSRNPQPQRVAQARPRPQPQQIPQIRARPQPQQVPPTCPIPQQQRVPQVRPRPTQPQQPQVCSRITQPQRVAQARPRPQPQQVPPARPRPQPQRVPPARPRPQPQQVRPACPRPPQRQRVPQAHPRPNQAKQTRPAYNEADIRAKVSAIMQYLDRQYQERLREREQEQATSQPSSMPESAQQQQTPQACPSQLQAPRQNIRRTQNTNPMAEYLKRKLQEQSQQRQQADPGPGSSQHFLSRSLPGDFRRNQNIQNSKNADALLARQLLNRQREWLRRYRIPEAVRKKEYPPGMIPVERSGKTYFLKTDDLPKPGFDDVYEIYQPKKRKFQHNYSVVRESPENRRHVLDNNESFSVGRGGYVRQYLSPDSGDGFCVDSSKQQEMTSDSIYTSPTTGRQYRIVPKGTPEDLKIPRTYVNKNILPPRKKHYSIRRIPKSSALRDMIQKNEAGHYYVRPNVVSMRYLGNRDVY